MTAEQSDKSGGRGMFPNEGLFTFLAEGAPLSVRIWNRTMLVMVFVVTALSLITLFGLIPASLSRLPGIAAASAMALLVFGWAYMVGRMPEHGLRRKLRLSAARALIANSAAVVTSACLAVLNLTDRREYERVAALTALAALIAGLIAVVARRRERSSA